MSEFEQKMERWGEDLEYRLEAGCAGRKRRCIV